jgi:hypothetical protein
MAVPLPFRTPVTLVARVIAGEVVLDKMSPEDLAVADDAFFDIANYSLICIALMRDKWGAPMKHEVSGE